MLTTTAQPVVLLDPITGATFTAAADIGLTAASGATLSIPTSSLVLGKLAAIKKLAILKALADEHQQQGH